MSEIKPYYLEQATTIYHGHVIEVLRQLPNESIQMVMTSPPYWGLRNYAGGADIIWGGNENCEHEWAVSKRKVHSGSTKSPKLTDGVITEWQTVDTFCSFCGAWRGQLGLEPTPELYVEHLMMIFREVKRVLRKDGSFYLNIGDTYAGGSGHSMDGKWAALDKELKPMNSARPQRNLDMQPKCIVCIPERVMFAMIEEGWILRNKIIWHKPNAMPSSVKDRYTTTWEYLYFFTKARKYYFDLDSVRVPHSTQSLERYISAIKRGEGGQGKIEEGIGTIQHRMGVDGICAVPKDIIDIFGHGPNPQSFNLRVRDVKRGKRGATAQSGELKASEKEIEEYEYPEKHHGSSHHGRAGLDNPGKYTTNPQPKGKSHFRVGAEFAEAFEEGTAFHAKGKNPGDYWELTTQPYKGAHFAVFPERLCERPIKASSRVGDIVLDPFSGSGTVGVAAKRLGRRSILVDCVKEYCRLSKDRIMKVEYQPGLEI